jgi:hypothetical protein
MALSDPDINNSIKKKDLKSFIKLCVDKKIISSSSGIFTDSFYQNQLDELYKHDDFEKFRKQIESEMALRGGPDTIQTFFLPFVLVIAVAAAVVGAIWAFLVFQESVYVDSIQGTTDDLFDDLNMVDIYALKTGMENTYIAVDEYTESIADESISILQEIQPNVFDNSSETEIRNLIKVNVVNNLAKFN